MSDFTKGHKAYVNNVNENWNAEQKATLGKWFTIQEVFKDTVVMDNGMAYDKDKLLSLTAFRNKLQIGTHVLVIDASHRDTPQFPSPNSEYRSPNLIGTSGLIDSIYTYAVGGLYYHINNHYLIASSFAFPAHYNLDVKLKEGAFVKVTHAGDTLNGKFAEVMKVDPVRLTALVRRGNEFSTLPISSLTQIKLKANINKVVEDNAVESDLRDNLRKAIKNESELASVDWGAVYGGEQRFLLGRICFGGISEFQHSVGTELVVSLDRVPQRLKGRGGNSLDDYKRVLDYVLYRSPWRHAYKDVASVEDAFERGIAMRVDIPTSEMMGAMIAFRFPYEYNHMLHTFCTLVDKGIEEHVAYMVGFMIGYDRTKEIFIPKYLSHSHTIFSCYMNYDGLFKFFKEGYTTTKEEKSFKNGNSSYSIFKNIDPSYEGNTSSNKSLYALINTFFAGKQKAFSDGWSSFNYVEEEDVMEFANHVQEMYVKA